MLSLYISFIYLFLFSFIFFFNATATTEIYTLSLHDALPIYEKNYRIIPVDFKTGFNFFALLKAIKKASPDVMQKKDRKSTRLNSSHSQISYAVFCLKKKKKKKKKKKYKKKKEKKKKNTTI